MSKCTICKKREGILDYTESTTDFIHGFIIKMCRQCYIEKIEKGLKEMQDNLIKQKKLLKKEEREERKKKKK